MKTLITSLFFTLSLSIAIAGGGKPKMKWSNEFKGEKGLRLADVVAKDKSGFYTLHNVVALMKRHKLTMKHYSYNLDEKKSQEIDLSYGGKKRLFENMIDFGGELRLFSTFVNTKDKKSYLFVETINKSSLNSKKDINKVAEANYRKKGKKRIGSSTFQFITARDSSKLLIFSNLPNKGKDNELIGCTVLNEEMKLLWNNNIEIPYPDKLFAIKDFNVSPNGDVYVLGKLYADKARDVKRGEANFKYQVIGYKKFGKEKVIYDVELPGKFITDMQININDDNDIICAGFFSNEMRYYVDGTYFLKINGKDKSIMASNTKEFSDDFFMQNLSDKQEKKTAKRLDKGKDVDLLDFDIDNLIVREDGGVVMIGEQFRYYVTTSTVGTGTNTRTVTTHHYVYNEIIVVNINPQGEIDWVKRIPKYQHTTNDRGYYSSYALMVNKDKLHFFYNDNVKNINLDDKKGKMYNWTKKPKNSVIMFTTINNEGEMSRVPIGTAKDVETMTRPKVCEQISDHQFVLYGEKGSKRYKFALVTPK